MELNDSELETVTKAEKNHATFSMLTISGTSQTSKVKIDGKVLVKLPKNIPFRIGRSGIGIRQYKSD